MRPLIRPVELASGRDWPLAHGRRVSTDDVFAMFVAAREGDVASVKRLVGAIPALATVEYNYTPPIHFAVREGHYEITELLLKSGADLAYRSYPFQESLLSFAEDRGHTEVAAVLQLAGASIETGDTPLHRASKSGDLDVVRALIAAGADVDAVRGDGYRPVHCALMPNWFFEGPHGARREIAELLLAHGARNTIFVAALRGDKEFVRKALAHDASLANFEDTCHHRVLSAAVRRGDVEMTRQLLDSGADANLPEEGAPRGLSLWIAVNDRQYELVRMLLAHGADPNAMVESSGTPMSQAHAIKDAELIEVLGRYGGRLRETSEHTIVGQLIESGQLDEAEVILRANPHLIHGVEGGWGDGVLAGPARDGRHDVLAMLMRLGATVPDVSKWAPNYYFKHEATAAFLLEHGMNPNHMNWHRFTLLHHMAAKGELAKAKLLLEHGADINAIDDEYQSTPLGVAARNGQMELAKLLLERGADPAAAGAPWAVPRTWAERKGHAEVARLLTSALAHSHKKRE